MAEVTANPVDPARPLRFSVLRVPFFLEPEYTRDEDWEETNRTRLWRKWGGEAGFLAQKDRHTLKERGLEVGIEHFNLDRLASSTHASHRLVQWATKTAGFATAESLYAKLNARHFECGQKLNDIAMLAEVAAEVGLDPVEAAEYLESGAGATEIAEAQSILARLGIHSIPTFIINGRRAVGGAARSGELTRVLRHVEAQEDDGDGDSIAIPRSLFADALGVPTELLHEPLPESSILTSA